MMWFVLAIRDAVLALALGWAGVSFSHEPRQTREHVIIIAPVEADAADCPGHSSPVCPDQRSGFSDACAEAG
jgi:hypothetical protein